MRGRFTEFEGTLEVGDDLSGSSAHGRLKAASITTEEEQRDEHLRSADFFDVEEFPEVTFESTQVEAIDDEATNEVCRPEAREPAGVRLRGGGDAVRASGT